MKKKTKKKDTSPQPPTESESKCAVRCQVKFNTEVDDYLTTVQKETDLTRDQVLETLAYQAMFQSRFKLGGGVQEIIMFAERLRLSQV